MHAHGGYHMAKACAGLVAADEQCSADFHYFTDRRCSCVPKGETCDVNDSAPNNRMAFRIVPGTPYEPASPPPPTPQQNYCRSKPSDAREAPVVPAHHLPRVARWLLRHATVDQRDSQHSEETGAGTVSRHLRLVRVQGVVRQRRTARSDVWRRGVQLPRAELLRVRQERRRRRVARRRRRRADDRAVVRVLRRPRALVLHGGGGERPRPRRPTRAARRSRREHVGPPVDEPAHVVLHRVRPRLGLLRARPPRPPVRK